MGVHFDKERTDVMMKAVDNERLDELWSKVGDKYERYDELTGRGFDMINELGKWEGVESISKKLLLLSTATYATALLMKRKSFRSMDRIAEELQDLLD